MRRTKGICPLSSLPGLLAKSNRLIEACLAIFFMANKGKSSTKDNGPSEPLNEASEAGDVTPDAVDEKTNAVNEPSNGADESTEAASVDVEISTQVLFSPSPTEWGDCELPLDTESLATPQAPPKSDAVPKVLCDMFNSGARFETAPKFTWNLRKEDKKARLRKELSVSFSVDTIVSSQEIIYGFDSAGIDVDEIISIQRRASNNTWVVSFRSPEGKEHCVGGSFNHYCRLRSFSRRL